MINVYFAETTRGLGIMGDAHRSKSKLSRCTLQVGKSVRAGLSACRTARGQRHTALPTAVLALPLSHPHTPMSLAGG